MAADEAGRARLSSPREPALGYFTEPEFDDLLVSTVTSTFPAQEHEAMVAHYRGLVGAWVADQAALPR